MLKLLCSSFSPLQIHPEAVPGQGWLWGTMCEVKGLNTLSAAIPSRVKAALSCSTTPWSAQPIAAKCKTGPRRISHQDRGCCAGTPPFSTALPRSVCSTVVPTPQCHRNADTHFWCLGVLHAFGVALCPWHIGRSQAVAVCCPAGKGALSGWPSLYSASQQGFGLV